MKSLAYVLPLLALAGCSAPIPSSVVIGQWEAQVADTGSKTSIEDVFKNMIASGITLDVRPDNTFRMVAIFVPIEGKWGIDGSTLVLTADKVFGFKPEETNQRDKAFGNGPMRLSIDAGKSTLTAEPNPNSPSDSLVFRKIRSQ